MVAPSVASLVRFLQEPPDKVSGFLFYGSDALQIAARTEALVQALSKKYADSEITRLHDSDLNSDPERIIVELATQPLFGGRKIIWLTSLPSKAQPRLLEAVAQPMPGAYLAVQAPDLKKSHKITQAFEAPAHLAAIACYGEDRASVTSSIQQQLAEAGYSIDADAIALTAARCDLSALMARSETEKLMTFMGSEKHIMLSDVHACLSDQETAGLQEVVDAALAGNGREALVGFDRLMSSEPNVTPILSVLSTAFQRLYALRLAFDAGASLSQAIKELRPPVFFKQQDALAAQVRGWPLAAVKERLARLNATLRDSRLKPMLAEALTREFILEIAKSGRSLQKRSRS
jgi:DNA polymerase-3 subunit delta